MTDFLLLFRSSLLKLADKMMVEAIKDAMVNAPSDEVTPTAVPAREAATHIMHNANNQIFPKL